MVSGTRHVCTGTQETVGVVGAGFEIAGLLRFQSGVAQWT
jgi:hypothetical protein